jgi:hypothetical protein
MRRSLIIGEAGLIMSLTILVSIGKAGLVGVTGGTASPSASLGPYTMVSFPSDTQSSGYTPVSSVESPLGGFVVFNSPLLHAITPGEWLTWSHGYNGDVYYSASDKSITMTMPEGTSAFYFYAQPNSFSMHTISVNVNDGINAGIEINQDVEGYQGASYYGFYGTDGSMVSSITVTCETADFAIGEFGIASVPAPGGICLGFIGMNFFMWLRRKHKFLRE